MMDLKFWTGVTILVVDQPLTWGSIALCTSAAVKTGKKKYVKMAGVIYLLSWPVFLTGVYLVGRRGLEFARAISHRMVNLVQVPVKRAEDVATALTEDLIEFFLLHTVVVVLAMANLAILIVGVLWLRARRNHDRAGGPAA